MTNQRVALYLQDSHDLRDGLDYVKYAEEKGFEAVWQAESRLVRDAIVPMAAYAAVLEGIFPGRTVQAALLYTSGPKLITLSAETLAAWRPGHIAP